jgi:hypothetical protein
MKGVGRLSINEIKKNMKEIFANSESPNVMTACRDYQSKPCNMKYITSDQTTGGSNLGK